MQGWSAIACEFKFLTKLPLCVHHSAPIYDKCGLEGLVDQDYVLFGLFTMQLKSFHSNDRMAVASVVVQVCSTLSFSGAGVFKRMNRGFDVVVIDEAAQAVSPSLASLFWLSLNFSELSSREVRALSSESAHPH